MPLNECNLKDAEFSGVIKVYLCTVPRDTRRSFDGLSVMAGHVIRRNPLSEHLLVFCNRRTDRLKILYWDREWLGDLGRNGWRPVRLCQKVWRG